MELKYKDSQAKEKKVQVGRDRDEVFLATCNSEDDRLLFVHCGKLLMGINLKGKFIIQNTSDLGLYRDFKRVSKLEIKAILGAD